MKNRRGAIITLTVACALLAPIQAAAQASSSGSVELRRFALIIGANNGGTDRTLLRYAQSDAHSVAKVISELGGVSRSNIDLLLDPDHSDLEASFTAMKRKLAAARGNRNRVELVVYYSGHSDEEGLLLAGKRYSYPQLRKQLGLMPADVKIAILDSCASGAFTRTKGGVKRPAFVIDESTKVRGHAFLSSSSADEAAQESDRIGASFFTHYLISGLRGAADGNGDSRVTLSEAYQFAFNETVTRTQATKHGAQHPAYDMHLVGTGDVIMTDLRSTSASLVLAKNVAGRLFIRDSSDRLVLEMRKSAGAPVVLGLGPERYQVILERGEKLFRAEADLRNGKPVTLRSGNFQSLRSEATVARGAAPGAPGADSAITPVDAPADETVAHIPFSIGLFPGLSSTFGRRTVNHVSINILVGAGDSVEGVEMASLVNVRTNNVMGAQLAGVGNVNGGNVRGTQLAGVGNWNGGHFFGIQAAGVGNVNGDWARGAQLAGVGNWNGGFMRGIQAAGVGNVNGGNVRGAQLAGVGNWNGGDIRGVQVAGVTNVTHGNVRGAQVAAVSNVANGRVAGAQIGLVNVGGDVEGLQVGLVNVARHVKGIQLGLVNVSKSNQGLPIGLATWANDGHRALEVWTSDLAPVSVGYKLGARNFYTMLALRGNQDVLMAGLGLGAHLQGSRFYIDVDVAGYGMLDHDFGETENDLLAEARIMVGIPILRDLSLFGGASLTGVFAFDGNGSKLTPLESKVYERSDYVLRLSPGLFAGVSY